MKKKEIKASIARKKTGFDLKKDDFATVKDMERHNAENIDIDQYRKDEIRALENNIIVPKIYFGSRTHKQITQLVSELRKTSYRPKMTILASRDFYCIHPDVLKSDNKTDECLERLQNNSKLQ
jgi:GH25 family lysozyme M1 (1,4-beta-N-acetylmuramidase)